MIMYVNNFPVNRMVIDCQDNGDKTKIHANDNVLNFERKYIYM